MLSAGVDPNCKMLTTVGLDEKLATRLVYRAVSGGHLEVVRMLLEAGADPDPNGDEMEQLLPPLVLAAQGGRLELLLLLLARGAAIDVAGRHGFTSLMAATMGGHLEVVRILLAKGVEMNVADHRENSTAFHFACAYDHPGCVEALARGGCDTSITNSADETGVQIATRKKCSATLKLLHSLSQTPYVGVVVILTGLVSAAEHNGKRAAVLQYLPVKSRFHLELLESGQRIAVRMRNFKIMCMPAGTQDFQDIVLMAATKESDTVTVERLLDAGADPNIAHTIALSTHCASQDVHEELWTRKVVLTAVVKDGVWTVQSSPLRWAAKSGAVEIVQLLLAADADPNSVDYFVADEKRGQHIITPLMSAAEHGQLDVLHMLLGRDAALNTRCPASGFTAFLLACSCNKPDCAEALVRAGCKLHIKSAEDRTGWEEAQEMGCIAVLKRLSELEGIGVYRCQCPECISQLDTCEEPLLGSARIAIASHNCISQLHLTIASHNSHLIRVGQRQVGFGEVGSRCWLWRLRGDAAAFRISR
jgi:ankyrin repeat protein